jgi:propanol-preferring alcohol dehydrogenase
LVPFNEGLIKHTIIPVKLDDINDSLEALRRGDVGGRAVIVYEWWVSSPVRWH